MRTSKVGISNRRAYRREHGFTLAELAIVVFIIALLSVITVPLLGNMGGAELKSVGRRLAGTVKYLYNESALEGLPYRLQFDLDHHRIDAQRQERDGEWKALTSRFRAVTLPGSVRLHEVFIAGRGSFSSGTVDMQVYPVGWLDETVVHLQDGSEKMTIRFSPLTGTAEFFEGHREFR